MEKKKKVGEFIKSYFFITLGLLINVFGWVGFIIPAEIVGGGITGLATIIYYTTDFSIGLSVLIFNSVLVLLAIKILGAQFAIKSIYGILIMSLFFMLLPQIITEPIVTDRFMSALIGGGIGGIGIAIAFINGGNSGGIDIIALIINKYRNISPGKIILYIDLVIIASSYFISSNIETVVYGYVVKVIFAFALDLLIEGAKQSYQLTVISQESHIIADRVSGELSKGVTMLKGTGWYTKTETDILLIIVRKHDKTKVMKIIAETDKNAFISQTKVSAVFGLNFDKIRY